MCSSYKFEMGATSSILQSCVGPHAEDTQKPAKGDEEQGEQGVSGDCRIWTGIDHPDFLYPELSGEPRNCPKTELWDCHERWWLQSFDLCDWHVERAALIT